jgi:two-component system sensor kinase FixL
LARAREAQRLKSATDLVAELSHQVNQPLAAIAAYAQGGAHRLRANKIDPADLLMVLDEIASEALRAGDIIRGLRETIGVGRWQKKSVDVTTLLGKSLRSVSAAARQAGCVLQLCATPDLPRVTCDGQGITQAVHLLLLHFIGRASGTSQRTLQVETATLGSETVEVTVREIRSPFVARVSSAAPSTLPPGLGVTISRLMIEAHGGEFWAADDPRADCLARFTLLISPSYGWVAPVRQRSPRA